MEGGAPRLDATAYPDPPPYNPQAPPPGAAPPFVPSNGNRSFEFYRPPAPVEPTENHNDEDAPGLAYLSEHAAEENKPREDRRVKFSSEGRFCRATVSSHILTFTS